MSVLLVLQIILPPVIMLIGVLGNILTILVYSRKTFRTLSTRNTLRILSLVEIFNVLQMWKHFALNTFNFNIYLVSSVTCKLVIYFSYFNSITAWLLTYISIERLLKIRFPRQARLANKHQTLIISSCIIWNLIANSQDMIYNDLVADSDYNNATSCMVLEQFEHAEAAFLYFDLINSTVLPFLVMLLSTVFLTYTVFKSRKKMARFASTISNRKLRRDIQFSMTLALSNLIFFLFNFPVLIYFIVDNTMGDYVLYTVLIDLYYTSYAVNFFIYLMTNSNFRREFFHMVNLKSNKHSMELYIIGSASN